MKKKALIALGSLCVLVLLATQALTVPREIFHGQDIRGNIVAALIALELSDSQKHDLAVILKRERAGQEKAVADLRAAVRQCAAEAFDKNMDPEKLREAYRRAAAAGEEVLVEKARMTAELRGVLTQEQEEVLKSYRVRIIAAIIKRYEDRQGLIDSWVDLHAGGPFGE
ncbi:MAG: hypothetical protein AB1921_03815 [Thermodesulfobacteriota bacterium]